VDEEPEENDHLTFPKEIFTLPPDFPKNVN
jgi:hypothetical protein